MRLLFLGTSSGTPTRDRNVSGLALRFDDGAAWIFDCGEATQHRIIGSDLRPGRISRIFLSHMHGDHCFGLPGLLASITVHDRGKRPVELVGPRGVGRWWQATRQVCHQGLSFKLTVTELDGPGPLGEREGYAVTAVALDHRIPSFGYVVREPPRRGRFDPARAAALGVAAGPDFGRLAAGQTVQTADGQCIAPGQVLGPERPGRSVAILGDTWCIPAAAAEAAAGCDVAVCECTYDASREEQARKWRHSTTTMVADFARRAKVRHVVLTHFSSRYTVSGGALGVADLVAEVSAACPGVQVHAANDGWELPVPDPCIE